LSLCVFCSVAGIIQPETFSTATNTDSQTVSSFVAKLWTPTSRDDFWWRWDDTVGTVYGNLFSFLDGMKVVHPNNNGIQWERFRV
jgi:hypothetical protein